MGGGKSSSKQTTDKSTKVTTETSTSINDIGLTGDDAVELAAVLQNGVTQQTLALGEIINPLVQQAGEGFNRLTAGASDLVKVAASEPLSKDTGSIFDDAGEVIGENLPLILAGIGAFFVFRELAK